MLSRKVLAVLLSAFIAQTALSPSATSAERGAVPPGANTVSAGAIAARPGTTERSATSIRAERLLAQTTAPTKEQRATLDLARDFLNAMGGLDKIKKFNATAYRVTGDYDQISSMSGASNKLDFELTSRGYQQKSKVLFMGRPVITCYDGKTCWTSHGDDVLPTDVVTAKRVREDLDHGYLLLEKLLDKGREMAIVPSTRKIDGQECLALSVMADDGKPTVFYIDPKTHLMKRSEYQGIDMEQGTECLKAYEYKNYKSLDGTLQPYETVEFSGNKRVGVLKVRDYTTKIELADNFFAMPGSQSIARLKQGAVVVPFNYKANEILVKASIDGQPEKVFLVDTGATQSIVDSDAATGLKTTTGDDFSITTGSGSMKMSYANIRAFKLGEIVLSNVPVAVTSMARFASVLQYKPAGLIGANVLKRFAITIDYDKQILILQDPDKFSPPSNAVAVDTKPSLGTSGLALEGTLDDKLHLTFLIDSGAAFNHVSESLIKDKFPDPILPVGTIKGLDGTPVNTGSVRFKTLKFGSLTVKNPIFSVAPSPPANATAQGGIISGGAIAIIGNPLLAHYRVTIDYRNQKLYFEKTQEREAEEELMAKLDDIISNFYKTGERNRSSSALCDLAAEAGKRNQPGVQALAVAYQGLMETDNADVPALLQATSWLKSEPLASSPKQLFLEAERLAKESKRMDIQAKTLALRALAEADQTMEATLDLSRAIQFSQTEASVYSMMAMMKVLVNKGTITTGSRQGDDDTTGATKTPGSAKDTSGAKNDSSGAESAFPDSGTRGSSSSSNPNSKAEDVILSTIHTTLPSKQSAKTDSPRKIAKSGMTILQPEQLVKQALMLDPADWPGLWVRRSIALERGRTNEVKLIEKQLQRYYPEARAVKALPD